MYTFLNLFFKPWLAAINKFGSKIGYVTKKMLNIHEVKFCNQPKTIYVYNIIEPNELKTVNIDLRFT